VPQLKSDVDVSSFDPEFTECDVESYSETMKSSHEEGKPYYGKIGIDADFSFDKDKEISDQPVKMEI